MYDLTNKEKLEFIIETSKKLGISSYEYGQNTSLSDLGARNILSGESKNPRTKNLNIMLEYLESKKLLQPTDHNFTEEPTSPYKKSLHLQHEITVIQGALENIKKLL